MTAVTDHYDSYYDKPGSPMHEGRRLGAIAKAEHVIDLWGDRGQDSTLIDIGCGDGAVTAALVESGIPRIVKGYDVSSSGVEIANKRNLPSASFSTYDGVRIPEDDKSFDLAVLSHVLEHVENPRMLLREARRVARFVFVEVPLEYLLRIPHHYRWTPLGHINHYDPKLIRYLLESTDLHVLEERVVMPSREAVTHREGRRGAIKWKVKETVLSVAPSVAPALFSYHGILIAVEAESRT